MRVLVFLASFFFMLLGSGQCTFAGISVSQCNSPVTAAKNKAEKSLSTVTCNQNPLASITQATVPEENRLYICEDVGTEDDNQSPARKYKSISAYFSALFSQPGKILDSNCFNAIHFFISTQLPEIFSSGL